jgi:hypothetical protein
MWILGEREEKDMKVLAYGRGKAGGRKEVIMSNRESEHGQSTLHACMETSQ